jgi:hypothetical protein
MTFAPVERMTWGWCHRARGVPPETLLRGSTAAWPGAMPGHLRAAGLHSVDARERYLCPDQHAAGNVGTR